MIGRAGGAAEGARSSPCRRRPEARRCPAPHPGRTADARHRCSADGGAARSSAAQTRIRRSAQPQPLPRRPGPRSLALPAVRAGLPRITMAEEAARFASSVSPARSMVRFWARLRNYRLLVSRWVRCGPMRTGAPRGAAARAGRPGSRAGHAGEPLGAHASRIPRSLPAGIADSRGCPVLLARWRGCFAGAVRGVLPGSCAARASEIAVGRTDSERRDRVVRRPAERG
jgi:hypothetical protein